MATKGKKQVAETDEIVAEEKEVVEEPVVEKTKKIVAKDVDLTEMITVKNGFNGRLVYISPRTHEKFVWDEFGDEQEIELRELRNAKSSAKSFFINNWFMFDEEYEWVINYLGLHKYYDHAIKPSEFDDLFDRPADELKEIVSKLSKGQRKSVGYMARQKIADGEIDSRKTVSMLESVLGIQLTEH